jgi:hypothetical protein
VEWWKLKPEELDEEQAEARRLAYYNIFYGTEEGRQILLDIKKICYETSGLSSDAVLARIALFVAIRANCGVNIETEKTAIDAEAKAIG